MIKKHSFFWEKSYNCVTFMPVNSDCVSTGNLYDETATNADTTAKTVTA